MLYRWLPKVLLLKYKRFVYTPHESVSQVLVKHGALIAISNKYGDMPLTKARPRLRKKLEGMWQGERGILL